MVMMSFIAIGASPPLAPVSQLMVGHGIVGSISNVDNIAFCGVGATVRGGVPLGAVLGAFSLDAVTG
jgi:hypothetical protein